jgi:quinol monooxygenase YgiN
MEIFLFARLHARPGKHSEVRQAMFDAQRPTRQEPGRLSYSAFRSVRDPDEF